MKRQILRRGLALLLTAALVLPLAACGPGDPATVQSRFDAFPEELFLGTMSSDFTSSLYFLEDPAAFGIDRSQMEVSVGTPDTDENFTAAAQKNRALLDTLHRFDRSVLTPEQQDTYDLLEWSCNISAASYEDRFRCYGSYFSNLSGVHTGLLTTLSELQVSSESDLARLPELLESIPPYFDSLIAYTRRQQEEEVLTIDFDSVIEVCDGVVAAGEESAVLQNLLAQAEGLGLSEEEAAAYQAKIRQAFLENFIPAYQAVADALREMQGGFNNEEGLAALPDGQDYYTILFQAATAVDESPEEVYQQAEERLSSAFSRLGGLAFLYPDLYNGWLEGVYETGFAGYEEMLAFLTGAAADFPAVGELRYVIDPIPEDVANSGVAAYFVNPAVDETGPLRIRVNTENTAELRALGTYMTLAHEGIPGHMYAASLFYQDLASNFRKVLGSQTGYNEGYATYVELHALEYLEGGEIPDPVLEMERLNAEMSYALVTMMDIDVNYYGLSREEFTGQYGSYFAEGFADTYYDLMRLEPTAYLSYYVGWMKIEALKEQAEKALDDAYTDLGFHTALLQSGSVPYFIVERNVQSWIDSLAAPAEAA